MKKTVIVTGLFIAISIPAFSQSQKTSSPAYDNVHLENPLKGKMMPANTKDAQVTNSETTPPSNHLKFSGDFMDLHSHTVQPYHQQQNKVLHFTPTPVSPVQPPAKIKY